MTLTGMHVSILLTDAEKAELADPMGTEWWQPGDDVYLFGTLPDEDGLNENCHVAMFDLSVNGKTEDTWVAWNEIPAAIQRRLKADAQENA